MGGYQRRGDEKSRNKENEVDYVHLMMRRLLIKVSNESMESVTNYFSNIIEYYRK